VGTRVDLAALEATIRECGTADEETGTARPIENIFSRIR
jgi:hypothetical protein